jgi:curved DNA-binding protein CbpA
MKDYYKILGLKSDATTDSVKQRFRELALENHPDVSDKTDANEIFMEIYEAYHILNNPDRKANYDMLYNKFIDNKNTFIPNEENVISYIRDLSASAREDAQLKAKSKYMDFIKDHDCFFKTGEKADGIPFNYNMHKTTGISGGAGPMGSIKSRSVRIPIPRSRRAHMIHRTGFLIKAAFFIIAILSLKVDFISDQGWILTLMISFSIILTGGLIVLLVYHLNSTKSKFIHAKKYFLVSKYRSKGFVRGFHPILSTTPAGLIAYLLRMIF